MQIQNFNKPEDAGAPTPRSDTTSASGLPPATGRRPAEDAGRHDIEIALLNAQIEHLELVVETARSLMTSNQENYCAGCTTCRVKWWRSAPGLTGSMAALR